MIGVIADDVTGATDVAAAIVVGLKTRTANVDDAVALSLRALESLPECEVSRFYFKYCSTFDSTPVGNIGPITDALADALDTTLVVTTPSAPRHRRTVYQGHLFVGDTPLAETHMVDHPLTPMTDSSVLRLLRAQTPHTVSHIAHEVVAQGETAPPRSTIRTAITAGSCSQRTLEQIDHYAAAGGASYRICASEHTVVADALGWFDDLPNGPALFFSSQRPAERGSDPDVYERVAGQLASGLAERGIRRLIVAGGETSGAVIDHLDVRICTIEEEEAPGVPWIRNVESGTSLLLKSGNFGPPDLFTKEAGWT
ncbi:four-carbon acid sugar kinase family protein [Actinopolymorpha alba]|uniref:four-carbon acid sugar kinase family protein n=1 Tax=Actinopolymorpha alba TaxID=533267 RepID=UPI0003703E9C|nr:four-carbon acid sugar kinase family protein [Actinopolymorpha alba]